MLELDTATLEHFVPLTSGGTGHMANLGLSCEPCNTRVGHLPVRAKLEIALACRARLGVEQLQGEAVAGRDGAVLSAWAKPELVWPGG